MNPVNMTIDERGRFWIVESIEYPRREAGPGRDRIRVLEDTTGDGFTDLTRLSSEFIRSRASFKCRGRYVWGGPGLPRLEFDAIRVSVHSPDERTPVVSITFRGEPNVSWVVADVPEGVSIQR